MVVGLKRIFNNIAFQIINTYFQVYICTASPPISLYIELFIYVS